MIPSFTSSTRTFQGAAWEPTLTSELARLKARHALIVSDPGVQNSGILDAVASVASQGVARVSTYTQVMQDPTARLMDDLGHRCVRDQVDVLIALGGGACLDGAKGAALVARHGGTILDLVGEDKVTRAPLPIIAIPTTAGTGSEVSWHISVNDTERQLKVTVRSPLAVASTAILDPRMVATVPQMVAAAAGMDALTHLLESFVSNVGRWDVTDALALHGISMVGRSLRPYWLDRTDAHHALQMQIASCVGGLVLSHSRTGIVHQMARPLGARFHVPHGLANATLLPWCLEYTARQIPGRFAAVTRALSQEAESDNDQVAADRLAPLVHALNRELGVPASLKAFGVTEDALDELAHDSLQGKPTVTNPCVVSHEALVSIYRNALLGSLK